MSSELSCTRCGKTLIAPAKGMIPTCPVCDKPTTTEGDADNYAYGCSSVHKSDPTPMTPKSEYSALADVLKERARQDEIWGEQNHDPFVYGAILTEEVGEFMQAALDTRFGGKDGGKSKIREEAVQVAAVALAIVECLDRGKWGWGNKG